MKTFTIRGLDEPQVLGIVSFIFFQSGIRTKASGLPACHMTTMPLFYLESLVYVVLSLAVVGRESAGGGLQILQVVSNLLGLGLALLQGQKSNNRIEILF